MRGKKCKKFCNKKKFGKRTTAYGGNTVAPFNTEFNIKLNTKLNTELNTAAQPNTELNTAAPLNTELNTTANRTVQRITIFLSSELLYLLNNVM